MAASNKKRKKLARELQAETGLRYTDALERVRLRTMKEEGMQVSENSPLMRAVQKQRSKISLETPEADALRPKVEEAVRSVLAVLAELPIRGGIRGVGLDPDEDSFGGIHQVKADDVRVALGQLHRHTFASASEDGKMELWLNGPMSTHMERLPQTVQISVNGQLEDPTSWRPNLQNIGLQSLRAALQICGWFTRPEDPRSKASALEEEAIDVPEFVSASTRRLSRRLSRIEHKRKSFLDQIEEDILLGVAQIDPSAEAILEKEVDKMTSEAESQYKAVSWNGELILDSDDLEALLVIQIEVGDERVIVGGPGGLPASCFRKGAEPAIRFQEREIPEGGKIRIHLKNPSKSPHVVGGSVRVRPSSLSFDMNPMERQLHSIVVSDSDLG